MPPKPQSFWHVLRETVSNWSLHGATTHSAALAYFSLFSLAPVLILVVATAGLVFGAEAAKGEVARELRRFLGPEAAAVVQQIVATSARPRSGRIAAAIGSVTLLVTATGALMQLQESLNTIWEVVPKPGFFLKRLLIGSVADRVLRGAWCDVLIIPHRPAVLKLGALCQTSRAT